MGSDTVLEHWDKSKKQAEREREKKREREKGKKRERATGGHRALLVCVLLMYLRQCLQHVPQEPEGDGGVR